MIPIQTMSESAEVQRLAEITFNKNLRQLLDGHIKDLRARPGSAERTLAFRAMQTARHWLGEDLAILGAQHPYPNGNNPANTIVDPAADVATRRHGELTKQAVAVDAEFKQTLAQIMGRNPDPTKSREFRATEQLNESDAAKVHNEASIAYQQHIGETPEQSNRLTVIDVEHKQVVGEAEQQNIINAATLVS